MMRRDCVYIPLGHPQIWMIVKPWQKLQPTLYPPVLPEALPHRSLIRADRLHGGLTSDMCTLQGTVGDCDFSLVKRRTQPGREKRGRN